MSEATIPAPHRRTAKATELTTRLTGRITIRLVIPSLIGIKKYINFHLKERERKRGVKKKRRFWRSEEGVGASWITWSGSFRACDVGRWSHDGGQISFLTTVGHEAAPLTCSYPILTPVPRSVSTTTTASSSTTSSVVKA